MNRRTLFTSFSTETNQQWYAIALLLLRISLGIQFLWAGISKMNGWSAEDYLLNATGPFMEFFQSLAGNPMIDLLNIVGLTLIGISLIVGICVRPASLFASVLMLLYFLAQFDQNTVHGMIDYHVMYILIFAGFMAGGVGHTFGLDGLVKHRMKKHSVLADLLFG